LKDHLGVACPRGRADRIGSPVELEGELCEAVGSSAHVLAHLLHLRRGLDQGGRVCDPLPVLASQTVRDDADSRESLESLSHPATSSTASAAAVK
jgi:hypothetical protein